MTLKGNFLRSIQPIAGIFPLKNYIKLSGQKLFAPFYHSISNLPLPHLANLYDLRSEKQFIADLDFLLKYYQPISLEDLKDQHKNKNGKPFFFLSFDDGLKEVYEVAMPMLLKKGVPATIFLNSAFVDNQDLFYRYKASVLIDFIEKEKITKCPSKQIESLLAEKGIYEKDVKQGLLKVHYHQREVLDRIADLVEVSFKDYLRNEKPYLTSAQINEMIEKGFSFGAHSIDHPEYHLLPIDEQLRQTKVSLDFVEKNYPSQIRSFSFPFTDAGVSAAFFEQLHQSDDRPQYTFGCAGLKLDAAPNHFQRFPMEGAAASAEALIKTEYLYYLLKSFLGKNRIKR